MEFMGRTVQFDHPEFLSWSWVGLLAVAVVCLVAYLCRKALRDAYSHPENLNRTTRAMSLVGFLTKALLWMAAAGLLIVALASPFEEDAETSVPEGSIHLVAAFDVSLSMAAEDYRFILPTEDGAPAVGPWGNRLQMSKHVFTEQVFKVIHGNKVGLVTFTADGYPLAPLCEDLSTLRYILTQTGWMGILSAPGGGSDYGEGFKVAVQTLRRDFDPSKRQVIMIFSDGGVPEFESPEDKAIWERDLGRTIKVFEALKAECNGNVHVVVVGVGGPLYERIPVYDARTWRRVDWFPLNKEEKAKTRLEDAGLKRLAELTGGTYIWLSTEGDTTVPVDWVGALGGSRQVKGKNYLSQYPLLAAMTLVGLLLGRGLFRRHDALTLPRPSFGGRD